MNFRPRAIAALFAAICTLGVTVAPVPQHYTVALTEFYGPAVPYVGSLDLTFETDGVVLGSYQPASVRSFVPVNGGLDGTHIWLDIGRSGAMHVTATIDRDGRIHGEAWDDGSNKQYKFVATPQSAASPP